MEADDFSLPLNTACISLAIKATLRICSHTVVAGNTTSQQTSPRGNNDSNLIFFYVCRYTLILKPPQNTSVTVKNTLLQKKFTTPYHVQKRSSGSVCTGKSSDGRRQQAVCCVYKFQFHANCCFA